MKFTAKQSRFLMSLVFATSIVACGSSSSMGGVENDITQPASPMQSSLSAASDSLASVDAGAGSTSSADVSASQQMSAMVEKTAGCVVVTTNPSPLDPNNLPQSFSIGWTYTNCARSLRGGTISGTRTVDITVDSNGFSAAQTFALQRDYINGAYLTADGNGTLTSTGSRASGSVARQVTGDGNRVFTGGLGNERFNHTYSHTLTVADTYTQDANANVLSQRVINGSGQLNHNLIGAVSMTDFNNITYQPANCAWPTSGVLSVATTFKGGSSESYSYSWGSPCGTVTVTRSGTVVQTTTLNDAP